MIPLAYLFRLILVVLGRHRGVTPEADHAAATPTLDGSTAGVVDERDRESVDAETSATLVLELARPAAPVLPALVVGADGWLVGDRVVRVPTKRVQKLRTGRTVRGVSGPRPAGIVWHWTATNHGTCLAMVRRTRELPKPGEHSASCHLWIESDGTIYQTAPLNVGTWNAGGPTAARFSLDAKSGEWRTDPKAKLSANSLFVGIELVNVGEVRKAPDGRWMGWPFGKDGRKGPIVAADQVVERVDYEGRKRSYQRYTDEQIAAGERVSRAMVAAYGSTRTELSWGHYRVDPTRKPDPGPDWYASALPALLDRVFEVPKAEAA